MLISATIKNVAAPHCSDERETNSQKMALRDGSVGKS